MIVATLRRSTLTVAAAIVAVVATACGSLGSTARPASGDATDPATTVYPLPPPLPAGTRAGSNVATSAALTPVTGTAVSAISDDIARHFPSAMPGQVITFRVAVPIPSLSSAAAVWRFAAATDADAERVAAAFDLHAAVAHAEKQWQVGGNDSVTAPTLVGTSGPMGRWNYFVGHPGAPRCPMPGSSTILPSGYPDCVAAASAPPADQLIARAVRLAALVGFDATAAPGSYTVAETDEVRTVSLFQWLDGFWNPVPLETTWGYDGELVTASGMLTSPTTVGSVARLGTAEAFARLGTSWLQKATVPPMPATAGSVDDGSGTVAPGTSIVAFPNWAALSGDSSSVAPTTGVAAAAVDSGAPIGETSVPTGGVADSPQPVAVDARISAARPALIVDISTPGELILAPAYVFTTQYGEVITTAVDAAALEPYR